MNPVMFCRNTSGIRRCEQSSTKCAPFTALSENSTPFDATIPTGTPHDVREAADQRRPEPRLELVEPRPVDQPRDHLADVVGRPQVRRHDAEDLLRVVERLLRRFDAPAPAGRARFSPATARRASASACASSSAR